MAPGGMWESCYVTGDPEDKKAKKMKKKLEKQKYLGPKYLDVPDRKLGSMVRINGLYTWMSQEVRING